MNGFKYDTFTVKVKLLLYLWMYVYRREIHVEYSVTDYINLKEYYTLL